MAIRYAEIKKNSKLTAFEDFKDAVIANTIKHKAALSMKKDFKQTENRTLADFD